MKTVLLVIMIVLIIINSSSFIYGKRKIKNLEVNNENSEELYKKGIRYVIISVVISFVTIIGASIIAIIYFLG